MAAEGSWLVFRAAGYAFALPVEAVERVLPVRETGGDPTPPLLDLAAYLESEGEAPGSDVGPDEARLVRLRGEGGGLRLRVETMEGILEIPRREIQPMPADLLTPRSRYLAALYRQEERWIFLIDPERLLATAREAATAS